MTTIIPKSYEELAQRLVLLQNRLMRLYEELGYRSLDDVRTATILNCRGDVAVNAMIFNIIVSAEKGILLENEFRLLFGLADPSTTPSWAVDKIAHYMRLSLPTIFQFRLDNMIANILVVIEKSKVTSSFHNNAQFLLDILSLEDKQRKLDVLDVLQNIRNSLHNNGIHNGREMSTTIDDCEFTFQKGQFVECASWGHIIIAMNASLNVVQEVLNSPKVRSIPEPISSVFIK